MNKRWLWVGLLAVACGKDRPNPEYGDNRAQPGFGEGGPFDAAAGWLQQGVLLPLMYHFGLMQWEDISFGWALFAVYGAAQVAVTFAVCLPLERWRPVENWPDNKAVWVDVLYTVVARVGLLPLVTFVAFYTLQVQLNGWLTDHGWVPPTLERLFPGPGMLADADLKALGLTTARAATVRGVAQALLDGRIDFRHEQPLDEFVERWVALPGIGDWTAHYMAMRALSHPDAFPAADLILRRVAAGDAPALSTKALVSLAQEWRPWRAYAVMHLWRSASDATSAAAKKVA